MSQARVSSIEALAAWKEAVCLFGDTGKDALIAVEMELRRAFDWLEEQAKHWRFEVRRREEQVLQAKNELTRKKMMPIIGKHPDTTEQEKALRKAQLRLAEAEEKIETCRRWAIELRRCAEEYLGTAHQLSGWLEGDLPRATAALEQRITALEQYASMNPGS